MDDLVAAAEVIGRRMGPTPQYEWPLLAAEVGATEVWVKHENHTPTGAFKVRGGLVYVGLDTEIVGVVAERANATALSFAAGHAVSTGSADTFVDGSGQSCNSS